MNAPESGISVYIPDEEATVALGRCLAAFLAPGRALLLYGDLGMGKSSLARGVIQALAPDAVEVPSPTFNLMLSYETANAEVCWHVDLYRIEAEPELEELGLEEVIESSITLIEWPERLSANLPGDYIACHFAVAPGKTGRMVTIRVSASLNSLGPDIANAITFHR